MARVTQEQLQKLNDFIDSLPSEARSKCALCNETLTHIVKTAEAQIGAGTATVTRALADRLNDGAAPGDRVSGEQLRGRVRQRECNRNSSGHSDQIKPAPEAPVDKSGTASPAEHRLNRYCFTMQYVDMAINQLKNIKKDDPRRVEALHRVKEWVEQELKN